MTQILDWPRIAVVGAGAVGGYFGGMLARAGAPVVMVGRKSFVDAVTANGLVIERAADQERVSVEATTELSAVAGADLILFCVKSNDTVSAAKEIAPFLLPDSLLVSLQNGVGNVERIRDANENRFAARGGLYRRVDPEAGTDQTCRAWGFNPRPRKRTDKTRPGNLCARRYRLPAHERHRRRDVDQTSVQLCAQCHLCAGTCALWATR